MFTDLHHRAIRILAAVLISSCSLNLQAQDVAASRAAMQQTNARLAATVGRGAASTAETRAMLISRHDQLVKVFHDTPERAREYALDVNTREALLKADPSYAALIEQDKPLTGELTSQIADDFVNHTARKQYSLHTRSGARAISFVAERGDLDRMLHHHVTVTGLSLPEIVAAETLREASPAEVKRAAAAPPAVLPAETSSVSAFQTVGPALASIGSGVAPGSATRIESPLGPQTTAVLLLKFAGNTLVLPPGKDQQSYYNQIFNGPAIPNIASFMNEVSYGQTSVSADIYGPITVPGNFNCNTTDAMANAAVPAAVASGLDVSKYNHFVFVYPVKGCYFGGLGNTGPSNATAVIPHQYTNIWFPIDLNNIAGDNFYWLAINHEFGHNLGLNHGNSIDFGPLSLGPLDYVAVTPGLVTPGGHGTDTGSTGSLPQDAALTTPAAIQSALPSGSTNITAVNTEYGEKFSNMGDGQAPFPGQQHVQELGWIPASGNQDVTTSGSFTIAPTETNTGLRTLHVLRDPVSSSWIWVEFHQSIGIYTPLAFSIAPYNVPNNVLSGAQLHYQDGFGDQLHTLLMDMTPTGTPNNFFDSNLTPGNSWSDAFSLLTITTGIQSGNSLGVSVSYDTPCAVVALSAPSLPAAGGSGSVTLTAPSTCSWSVSSNASWISFTGATTGTGNGKVNFSASANTATGQRNSYITAQRQSLPLVQDGQAITVAGLSPAANTVAATAFVPLTLTLTDAKGAAADISQINFTVTGGAIPDCVIAAVSNGNANNIDLYLSTNGTYSAAVTTGTAGTLTNSSCTIDPVNSKYAASGNTATLTLALSFPATFLGVHSINASAQGAVSSSTYPVGLVNVTNSASAPQSVAISPASASAPLSGSQGTTVPFTITGVNTAFTAASTVQMSGKGVAVSGLTFVSATKLTGNVVVSSTAPRGQQTLTVTTGTVVNATTFTVTASTISLSPSSGLKGATVPVTISGTNTTFLRTSTVTISGTRIQVNKVKYVSPTELTVELVLDTDAASDPRTITVTSGSEVDTAVFTVTPDVTSDVQASPATGNKGDRVYVIFTGTDTNFDTNSTIKISGDGLTIKDMAALDPTRFAVDLIISKGATAGARTVTITTGTQTATGSFSVTAYTSTTTTIKSSAPSIASSKSITLTIKVTAAAGTPVGYVSVTEDKGGAGFKDILETVALSGGEAVIQVSNLSVGVHKFSAQYLGDKTSFALSDSKKDARVSVTP